MWRACWLLETRLGLAYAYSGEPLGSGQAGKLVSLGKCISDAWAACSDSRLVMTPNRAAWDDVDSNVRHRFRTAVSNIE
jgi:hypothetical protein